MPNKPAAPHASPLLDAIAVRYLPRIRRIARGMCHRLPTSIDADDLAQAGIVGMLTALRAFDPARGDSLDTYLAHRVRGAILDELRGSDPLSRDQRRDARTLKAMTTALEHALGRAPTEEELAGASDLPVTRLRELRQLTGAVAPVPLEDALAELVDRRSEDPVERIADADLRRRLAGAIASLAEREQLVLSLYYGDDLSLKEIGRVLGVTESRVCQIHGSAVRKLRVSLPSVEPAAA